MDFATIFQSQKEFFNSHQTKNVAFRKETLLKLKNLLKANEERLYDAIYKDFRKGRFDTFLTELNLVYNEIDFFLKNLDTLSKPKKVKTSLSLQPGKSHIYYDPLGVLDHRSMELPLSADIKPNGKCHCSRKYKHY